MAEAPKTLDQIAIAQQISINLNTTLIFGESGTAKSTNIGFEAERIFRETGKITRIVYGDLGGDPYRHLILAGIVNQVRISALEKPMLALRRLSKGWWPTDPKKPNQLQDPGTTDWSKIGMYGNEGLTCFGDIILRWLRLGGKSLSQDPNYSIQEKDELTGMQETFYGSNMSYYGFIQDTLFELVANFAQLPIQRVIWSALEARGEDQTSGETVIGPALAGKKAGPKVPSWVGDCLHFDLAPPVKDPKTPKPTDILMQYRAYFINHQDKKTLIPYKCKPRVPARQFLELLKRWPEGWFPLELDGGLDRFLKMEEDLVRAGAEQAQAPVAPAAVKQS